MLYVFRPEMVRLYEDKSFKTLHKKMPRNSSRLLKQNVHRRAYKIPRVLSRMKWEFA